MHYHPDTLHPGGAGHIAQVDRPARRDADIDTLRPLRALLSPGDYWQMQAHRRRCEELGGAGFLRLARLIRAKSADAQIIPADELRPGTVTGAARISFATGRQRPMTCTLYHWDYPARGRGLPVGSFLGITLIGMSAGQCAPLISGDGVRGEVQVLAVHTQAASGRAHCA
ncbi:hypothetical protein [Pararhodobacter sp.]|uniref:hypothetical protein n=1 Tax=Pararhodobacter sp. TaxID=2127056 RepID=UPI002FDDF661